MCAKIFLECKMNQLNSRGTLSWAAENGHERIVKLLLVWKDVNPDTSSKYGLTLLSLVAGNSHEGIVKLLLEWGHASSD